MIIAGKAVRKVARLTFSPLIVEGLVPAMSQRGEVRSCQVRPGSLIISRSHIVQRLTKLPLSQWLALRSAT